MLASLLTWAMSLVFGALLARALAHREELKMDYRAAGAAAYLGLGAVWALGLSSSAAQLQANPASLPPSILAITGGIPLSQTLFLWQSGALLLVLQVALPAILSQRSRHGPQRWDESKALQTAGSTRSAGPSPRSSTTRRLSSSRSIQSHQARLPRRQYLW